MLDADQRAFFAEHGWLVVRGAVACERVAELERAVDEIYLAHAPAPMILLRLWVTAWLAD